MFRRLETEIRRKAVNRFDLAEWLDEANRSEPAY